MSSNKVDNYSTQWGKASKVAPVDGDEETVKNIEETGTTNLRPSKLKEEVKVEKQSSGLFEFANSDAIKQKVRDAKVRKDKYNVHNMYHETGLAQRIAKSSNFENIVLGVILANVVWIAIDTDYNEKGAEADATLIDYDAIFIAADICFFSFFSLELIIRFCAFKKKKNCMKDGWFVFDSALVILYAFDPFLLTLITEVAGGSGIDFPTSLLRLLRLARLSRLVRTLRFFPELMIMIKGMVTAASTVSYTLALLVVITYVFAIALTQLSADSAPESHEAFFRGVALSMYSLIIYGTFLDNLADFCGTIKAESTPCLMIVTVFVVLASLTVMNMLIGVLCEVISAVAEEERETMITDKVYEKFQHIVKEIDANNDGSVSWKEFQSIMDNPAAIAQLESVGVDPLGMIDFAQDAFQADGQERSISFKEFMDIVLDLRGSQMATLKDLMTMQKHVNVKFSFLKSRLEEMDKSLDEALGDDAS